MIAVRPRYSRYVYLKADVKPMGKLSMEAAKALIRDSHREMGVSYSFVQLRELLALLTQ